VQESQRAVEDVDENRACHLAIVAMGAQPALDRLQVPIGELVPDEATRAFCQIAQPHAGASLVLPPHPSVTPSARRRRPQRSERCVGLDDRGVKSPQHPVVGAREPRPVDVAKPADRIGSDVREQEPADVPELRGEIAAGRERLIELVRIENHVRAESHSGDERPPQCIGAIQLHDDERIDAVAERLRHLAMLRVAGDAVQVDGVVRCAAGEEVTGHDHPRDPEEQNVWARDEDVRRVKCFQILGRFIGPAKRREWPEPR
jgi:hypothetical protein